MNFMLHTAMTSVARSVSVLLILCLAATSGMAQKKKSSKATSAAPTKAAPSFAPSTVLATVGSEQVLLGDVERAFQKNLTRRDTRLTSVARDTALEFLRLYTNYRLKVADGRDRGLEQDSAVRVDLQNNRRLLSETFYFDKAVAEKRIRELAIRRMTELEIGVILCAVPEQSTRGWDSAASRRKGERLIAQLKAGADFEKLARDSSDDKETASNGGRLPWISAGSIIKVVEDAAYGLPVGGVCESPLSSRYGYFIVKVYQRSPRINVKFRHILLTPNDDRDSIATDRFADTLVSILAMKPSQQNTILTARKLTPSGDAFGDLAKAYSDDKTSASKGGYLGGAYSRSSGMENNGARLVKTFEEAIFGLRDGQISGKVKTIFGTHIIIRDSSRVPDSLLEYDNSKRTYRRLYYEEDKRMVLDSVRKTMNSGWNEDVLSQVLSSIDSNKNTQDTGWVRSLSEDLLDRAIFRLPGSELTVRQFADTLRRRIDMRGFTLNRAGFDRAMNKIADPIVLDRATSGLEQKYEDFAALMREFNDGILLFKVEEKEVWSRLKFDTTDARAFYDTTRSRWMTERKFDLTEVYVLTDSLLALVNTDVKAGKDLADIAASYSQRDGVRELRGKLSAVSAKSSKVAQQLTPTAKVGDVIGPVKIEAGWSIIRLDRIIEPEPKTFEAALTELAPAYQDALQKRLTESWLSNVRSRHPVSFNSSNIDKIWGAPSMKAGSK
ncbi:MAG: Parvulin-like peptidyl-prolyl isomerase [Bacteroidota bacterium]|jgi:peptidyl-prolyl cis-trans isomerase SurA